MHKGLDFTSRPIRFTDKAALAFSGQKRVPVLRDGERVVHDSMAIFQYLDEADSEHPLMGEPRDHQRAKVIERLTRLPLGVPLMKILALRIHSVSDVADRDYFRQSREQSLGQPLESFTDPRGETRLFREALKPLEGILADQPFLEREVTGGVDYLVMGLLLWPRCLGAQPWEDTSAVGSWFKRLLSDYEQRVGPIKRASVQNDGA